MGVEITETHYGKRNQLSHVRLIRKLVMHRKFSLSSLPLRTMTTPEPNLDGLRIESIGLRTSSETNPPTGEMEDFVKPTPPAEDRFTSDGTEGQSGRGRNTAAPPRTEVTEAVRGEPVSRGRPRSGQRNNAQDRNDPTFSEPQQTEKADDAEGTGSLRATSAAPSMIRRTNPSDEAEDDLNGHSASKKKPTTSTDRAVPMRRREEKILFCADPLEDRRLPSLRPEWSYTGSACESDGPSPKKKNRARRMAGRSAPPTGSGDDEQTDPKPENGKEDKKTAEMGEDKKDRKARDAGEEYCELQNDNKKWIGDDKEKSSYDIKKASYRMMENLDADPKPSPKGRIFRLLPDEESLFPFDARRFQKAVVLKTSVNQIQVKLERKSNGEEVKAPLCFRCPMCSFPDGNEAGPDWTDIFTLIRHIRCVHSHCPITLEAVADTTFLRVSIYDTLASAVATRENQHAFARAPSTRQGDVNPRNAVLLPLEEYGVMIRHDFWLCRKRYSSKNLLKFIVEGEIMNDDCATPSCYPLELRLVKNGQVKQVDPSEAEEALSNIDGQEVTDVQMEGEETKKPTGILSEGHVHSEPLPQEEVEVDEEENSDCSSVGGRGEGKKCSNEDPRLVARVLREARLLDDAFGKGQDVISERALTSVPMRDRNGRRLSPTHPDTPRRLCHSDKLREEVRQTLWHSQIPGPKVRIYNTQYWMDKGVDLIITAPYLWNEAPDVWVQEARRELEHRIQRWLRAEESPPINDKDHLLPIDALRARDRIHGELIDLKDPGLDFGCLSFRDMTNDQLIRNLWKHKELYHIYWRLYRKSHFQTCVDLVFKYPWLKRAAPESVCQSAFHLLCRSKRQFIRWIPSRLFDCDEDEMFSDLNSAIRYPEKKCHF